MKHIAGTAALGTGPRHPRPGLEPTGLHISGGVQSCQEPGSIFQHHSAARAVPASWPDATGGASAARARGTRWLGNLEEQGCELEIVAGRRGAQEEAGTAMSEMSGRDGLRFP